MPILSRKTMKKLLLLLVTTYALMANSLPQSVSTTVSNINNDGSIQLSSSVPKGMSGVIIHNYGNGLTAITHSIITQEGAKATVLPYTAMTHKNIPNIQTDVKVNDQVILGNFYNNVLLIAPNARSYENISKSFQRTWIHPDAYAVDFMDEGDKAISLTSLKNFAEQNQVGLVLIVTQNRLRILDPISQQFLGEQSISGIGANTMSPFFARFNQTNVSLFDFSSTNYTPYYQAMEALK